ncbi:MAG: deoxyribonuclease IV [Planctomycetes bacterium]|nr:deoxyribonuclease IV [Planctomycetota bacterium]
MNLGAHMSIAGGLHHAILAAEEVGARTLQVFTKQSSQWRAKPITEADLVRWKAERERTKIGPIVAHDSYLINLGQPDETKWREACEAFRIELERCEALEIRRLIMHPGAHLGSGEEAGLRRIAQALDVVHARTAGFAVRVCLEATAGQGTNLGYRFEHLRRILDLVHEPDRVGVCVDTCHIFAAGYDIRTSEGYARTFDTFDRIVGLNRILAFHVNDSKKPFLSRVDRHEHIGRGFIGSEAFRCLMRDERFRDVPMLLETPKDPGMEVRNLALLRAMRAGETANGAKGETANYANYANSGGEQKQKGQEQKRQKQRQQEQKKQKQEQQEQKKQKQKQQEQKKQKQKQQEQKKQKQEQQEQKKQKQEQQEQKKQKQKQQRQQELKKPQQQKQQRRGQPDRKRASKGGR